MHSVRISSANEKRYYMQITLKPLYNRRKDVQLIKIQKQDIKLRNPQYFIMLFDINYNI